MSSCRFSNKLDDPDIDRFDPFHAELLVEDVAYLAFDSGLHVLESGTGAEMYRDPDFERAAPRVVAAYRFFDAIHGSGGILQYAAQRLWRDFHMTALTSERYDGTVIVSPSLDQKDNDKENKRASHHLQIGRFEQVAQCVGGLLEPGPHDSSAAAAALRCASGWRIPSTMTFTLETSLLVMFST